MSKHSDTEINRAEIQEALCDGSGGKRSLERGVRVNERERESTLTYAAR